MSGSKKAELITVEIQKGESGAFFATSGQMRGLHVARMSLTELHDDIPRAISALYAARGTSVTVSPVNDPSKTQWLATPSQN